MIRRSPISTLPDTLVLYSTLFRSHAHQTGEAPRTHSGEADDQYPTRPQTGALRLCGSVPRAIRSVRNRLRPRAAHASRFPRQRSGLRKGTTDRQHLMSDQLSGFGDDRDSIVPSPASAERPIVLRVHRHMQKPYLGTEKPRWLEPPDHW